MDKSKYGMIIAERQMSESFELLDIAGDISGNLRLIYGSGPTDPAPFVLTLTPQYVARVSGKTPPVSLPEIELCEHLCFDCLASLSRYAGYGSLMDSSLDVSIAKKQIGSDVEAAIGDTSLDRCGPWFPAKIAALGT